MVIITLLLGDPVVYIWQCVVEKHPSCNIALILNKVNQISISSFQVMPDGSIPEDLWKIQLIKCQHTIYT